METAIAINGSLEVQPKNIESTRRVSSSHPNSASPSTYTGTSWASRTDPGSRTGTGLSSKQLKPFNAEDIKILLLENVNATGRDLLQEQGYQVTSLKTSLPEDDLIERIRWGNASL